jgi:hypothetical protein
MAGRIPGGPSEVRNQDRRWGLNWVLYWVEGRLVDMAVVVEGTGFRDAHSLAAMIMRGSQGSIEGDGKRWPAHLISRRAP